MIRNKEINNSVPKVEADLLFSKPIYPFFLGIQLDGTSQTPLHIRIAMRLNSGMWKVGEVSWTLPGRGHANLLDGSFAFGLPSVLAKCRAQQKSWQPWGVAELQGGKSPSGEDHSPNAAWSYCVN